MRMHEKQKQDTKKRMHGKVKKIKQERGVNSKKGGAGMKRKELGP